MIALVIASAVAMGSGPSAAADPEYGNGSAESVIDGLEADGYNVVINWLTGYNTKPLSSCWVSHINNPGGFSPKTTEFVTVYVDVSCPNNDYY
jgi:hypothetical protein